MSRTNPNYRLVSNSDMDEQSGSVQAADDFIMHLKRVEHPIEKKNYAFEKKMF